MKLTNVGQFDRIDQFVTWKLEQFGAQQKNFANLFYWMFSESDNVMAEISDGYRIQKITYGEVKQQIERRAAGLAQQLDLPQNSIVGIYMDNSIDWPVVFWSVLRCGYRPLLMNMRLPDAFLEQTLADYGVQAVISDQKEFSVQTLLAKDILPQNQSVDRDFGEEVIFMSSGTGGNVKLCAYTAENFYYQLANSVHIVKKSCPEIANHYQGELKLLTLLPFYHVFGFMAVYLWFCFFSRTLVFLKDLNPKTIQNTVKKHKVTHVFAVPLVWEAVYKAAIRAIKGKGEKTYQKFTKGIQMANASGIGQKLTHKKMAEVRESLFGESIQFLISGGGAISQNALEFFNGIGYHLANGYGMTEVGITSVDSEKSAKLRNLGSIGAPFLHTDYKIDPNGILLIRGKNMASRICTGKNEQITDFDQWFNSNDLCELKDGRYYLRGRKDDLIVTAGGENLNPQMIEDSLRIRHAEELCLIGTNREPVLLVRTSACYSENKINCILQDAKAELEKLGLHTEIRKVVITPENFLQGNEFKRNRKKIAERFAGGTMTVIDADSVHEKVQTLVGGLESKIRQLFGEVLQKNAEEIGVNASFFTDLNGSSLDYFVLSDAVLAQYGVDIKAVNGKSLSTVAEICNCIQQQ